MSLDPFRLRILLSVAGFVVALFGLWRFSEGALDAEGVVLFLPVLLIPYAMYMLLVRTRRMSLWAGLILIAMIIGVQMMVSSAWERGSSTAPIAYLWLPLAGAVVVAVAAFLDRRGI